MALAVSPIRSFALFNAEKDTEKFFCRLPRKLCLDTLVLIVGDAAIAAGLPAATAVAVNNLVGLSN